LEIQRLSVLQELLLACYEVGYLLFVLISGDESVDIGDLGGDDGLQLFAKCSEFLFDFRHLFPWSQKTVVLLPTILPQNFVPRKTQPPKRTVILTDPRISFVIALHILDVILRFHVLSVFYQLLLCKAGFYLQHLRWHEAVLVHHVDFSLDTSLELCAESINAFQNLSCHIGVTWLCLRCRPVDRRRALRARSY
jgi:hypothetical protein